MSGEVHSQLGDVSNVLLMGSSMDGSVRGICNELLEVSSSGDLNVLWVTLSRTPESCFEGWIEHAGGAPANVRVIAVGDSVQRDRSGGSDVELDPRTVETVGNPSDLTGLSIGISEVLREWNGDELRAVVCFDSITTLLQYVELETVYEFLHVLTGRLYAVGALGHFHVDPSAHDDRTVENIVSLFDAAVEIEDGEPSIRSRS